MNTDTPEQAADRLHAAVAELVAAGLVVTGELKVLRPREPGRVEVRASRDRGPLVTYRLWTEAAAAAAVGTSRPPSEPLAVGLATSRPYAERRDAGAVCSGCGGSNLRWAGACQVCSDCGTSGGCS